MTTTAKQKPRGPYRLTPAGLNSHRRAAYRTKPWESSTGPRTPAGKDRSRWNALKHGERSAAVIAARRQVAALMQQLQATDQALDQSQAQHIAEATGTKPTDVWLQRIASTVEAITGGL